MYAMAETQWQEDQIKSASQSKRYKAIVGPKKLPQLGEAQIR